MRSLACLTAVTLWSTPALSADVGALTTFTAGTPAVASEVNGNFDALATAVNSKQDRVTGTCAAGSAVSQVNADGSVGCTPLTAAGAASVSGHALVAASYSGPHICGMRHLGPWSFFSSDPIEISNFGCTAAAPISLPHGATLTGLTCRLSDAYDNGSISLSLVRAGVTADGGSLIFSLPATTDVGDQYLADTTALGGTDVVNNVDYAYHLTASFDLDSPDEFFEIEQELAIAGCSVTYTGN